MPIRTFFPISSSIGQGEWVENGKINRYNFRIGSWQFIQPQNKQNWCGLAYKFTTNLSFGENMRYLIFSISVYSTSSPGFYWSLWGRRIRRGSLRNASSDDVDDLKYLSLRSRRLEVVGTPLACLPRARPFSLSPTTSKRLLRWLEIS